MAQLAAAVKVVSAISEGAEILNDTSRALEKVKEGLHAVKVSEVDATEVQREVEGEMFDKWEEGCEVKETKKIAMENIPHFLDHIQEAYEGIDEDMRKKMSAFEGAEEWAYKVMEFKCNSSADSRARYGMIAFGKSTDGKSVDCMYCLYKLDFKVAPQRIVTNEEHTILGLFTWETATEKVQGRALGIKSLKRIKNFFRYKALVGFLHEGLIDQINVVPSINDVPDKVE